MVGLSIDSVGSAAAVTFVNASGDFVRIAVRDCVHEMRRTWTASGQEEKRHEPRFSPVKLAKCSLEEKTAKKKRKEMFSENAG